MDCPPAEELAAFGQGQLSQTERTRVEAHLDVCDSCCRVASEMARIFFDEDREEGQSVTLQEGQSHGDAEIESDRPLLPGSRLDRYHILEPIGEGAMGVVYAAYDPDLDRKVALKVLRDSKRRSEERSMMRLLREAQAMARLSHPNVITVHEARVVDQRLFISMEFVQGCTLKQWLARNKPDWQTVLTLFTDVARAIAAAHAAGLIHRDVKPDNILVGEDGRVRVTDFGLARPSSIDSAEADRTASHSQSISTPGHRPALAATFTRHGALVGTPAYMSPEQLSSRPATEASDQFSFCVALFEALYGHRPFAGSTLGQLSRNVLEGRVQKPDDHRGVPRWLDQVVMRGLSVEPHERWPNMEALQIELSRDRRRLRATTVGLGLAAMALTAVGSLVGMSMYSDEGSCDPGPRGAAHLWSGQARQAIQSSLTTADLPYAADTAQQVVERLDVYTQGWDAMYRDACEAHQRGEQSDAFFDLRMSCLDERRRELEALLLVLAEADGEVVRNAVDTVEGLRRIEACADLEALSARVPLPDEPRAKQEVAEIETELARVRVLTRSGRYVDALDLARTSTNIARTATHEPVLAKALFAQAQVEQLILSYEDATEHLREAWQVALRVGDDQLAAEALIGLVETLGHGLHDYEAASARAGDASSMIDRVARQDPDAARLLEGELYFARGKAELRALHLVEASDLFERALEVSAQTYGADSLHAANLLNSLGTATQAQLRHGEALAYYRQALRIRQRYLGDHHPQIAGLHNNIGLMLKQLDRLEEAYEALQLSYQTMRKAMGKGHELTRMARLNLAEVCFYLERHEEAIGLYAELFPLEELESILQVVDPVVHPRIGRYGKSLKIVGRHRQALQVFESLIDRLQQLDASGSLRTYLPVAVELTLQEQGTGSADRAVSWSLQLVELQRDRETPPAIDLAEAQLLLAKSLIVRSQPGDIVQARELSAQGLGVLREAGLTERADTAQRELKALVAGH